MTVTMPEPTSDLPVTRAAVERLRAENAELRALVAIQRDLSRGSTPQEVLQEVVAQVQVALGSDRCYALLWDPQHRRITPAATTGLPDHAVMRLKEFIPGREPIPALMAALTATEPLLIEDARSSDLLPAPLVEALGMATLLIAPIRGLAPEARGLLVLDFDAPQQRVSSLTSEIIHSAEAIADQLTLLLENAVLYEQLRRRTLRLEALNEIGLALAASASGDPIALFNRLQPRVADVVDGVCLLATLDEGSQRNQTMTVWWAGNEMPPESQQGVPLGTDTLSTMIRSGRRPHLPATETLDEHGAVPQALADLLPLPIVGSAIYLPLRLRRRTFGALVMLNEQCQAYSTEQIEFLTTVAAQTAVTLDHARLYGLQRLKGEMRRRLLDQTLQAQEAERKALVDGILDGALQELASCNYRLDLCIRLSELNRHDQCREELRATRQQLAERIGDLRTTVGGLRPPNLDILGLQSVIREELTSFQRRTGIATSFHGRFKERLDSAIETRAYRITQELLANVRRHARAKSVTVELQRTGDGVLLSMTDDGIGFDTARVLRHNAGMGLHAVREGAELVGGSVRVQSRPGMGTRIEVILPSVVDDHPGSSAEQASWEQRQHVRE